MTTTPRQQRLLQTARSLLRQPLLWAIAAALLVATTAGAFLYPLPNRPYQFEVELTSTAPGLARLYFNRNVGSGEDQSSRQSIDAGVNALKFPLPAGKFSVLRLDPLIGHGRVRVGEVRITGPGGLTVHRLPARAFVPNYQIIDVSQTGSVREMAIPEGATAPHLLLAFNPRLPLPGGLLQRFLTAPWALSAWFFCTLFSCLAAERVLRHLVERARRNDSIVHSARRFRQNLLHGRLIWPLAIASLIAITAGCLLLPEPVYIFEVELTASEAGVVKLYYNRGLGFGEQESSRQPVIAGENTLRLRIPPGKVSMLRFDPLPGKGRISFGEVRIVGPGGWIVRRIPAGEFEANESLEDIGESGAKRGLLVKPGPDDPQLAAIFNPRLPLPDNPLQRFLSAPWTLLGWFLVGFASASAIQYAWRVRGQWTRPAPGFIRRHPRLSIAICAVVAGVTASYPVVFFGRSFISPNNGAALLYGTIPTVPQVSDATPEWTRAADIGAMMWAHMPYTVVQSNALYHEGSIPLWNRHNSCGLPLLGQGQSMIGEPLNFLVALTGAQSWAFDLKYVLCKILFACGLGWCVWLVTRDLAASLIITFAGAFIAFFNYRVNHPGIFSMGYSPWILVAWLQLIYGRHPRNTWRSCTLWLLANWMVLTSGTVKEAYALIGALNLTGAVAFLAASRPLEWKLRSGGIMTLAGVALALTAAPIWWTMFDTLAAGGTIYDTPGAFQIPRAWLAGLFDDIFYLELSPSRYIFAPAANMLILLGFLWAVVQPLRLLRDRVAIILLLGFLLAISVGFKWMPSLWILGVPWLQNVHHLGIHFSCIAIVHAAVLAGWGFSAARAPLQSCKFPWEIAAIAGLLIAILLAFFRGSPALTGAEASLNSWLEAINQHAVLYAHVLMLPVAFAVLTWIAARYLRHRILTLGMVFAAIAALAFLLVRHGQHLSALNAPAYLSAPGPRADLLVDSAATQLLRDKVAAEPSRIIGMDSDMFSGFMSVYGFEGIDGPDAIYIPRLRDFLITAEMMASYDWRVHLSPANVDTWQPMLDFLNVRYIATRPKPTLDLRHHRRIAALDLAIYQSETCWPRAFFTNQLGSYNTTADFVELLRAGQPGDPFAAIQAGDKSAPDVRTPAVQGSASTLAATDYQISSNTSAFTIVAPGPGYAVLHENWLADDFRATINGVPTPYFRVNHIFKGIIIPRAGTYHISFSYWPRHFNASLIWCGIGLGSMGGLLWFVRRNPDLDEKGELTTTSGLDASAEQSSPAEFRRAIHVTRPLSSPTTKLWASGLAFGVVVTILGARWAIIGRCGMDLPEWDQWDAEGLNLLLPWSQGRPLLSALFTPHNEHYVVLTKLVALGLTLANGLWDQRLESVVNAFLPAMIALGFCRWALQFGRPSFYLTSSFFLAAAWSLPLAWHNIVAGFHSQQLFLIAFSCVAIGILPFVPGWSRLWWMGSVSAGLALLSMASGVLAAAVVVALIGFRWLLGETTLRRSWPSLFVAIVLFAVGWISRHEVDYHSMLKAGNLNDFLLTVGRALQWPAAGSLWFGPILWLPWLWNAIHLITRRDHAPARVHSWILLGLGGWVLAQLIASGYARGAGGPPPAVRYLDTLVLGCTINFLCLGWIWHQGTLGRFAKYLLLLVSFVWSMVLAAGVARECQQTFATHLPQLAVNHDQTIYHVRAYLMTGDETHLDPSHIPYPSAGAFVQRISHPELMRLMPAGVRPALDLEPYDAQGFTSFVPMQYPPLGAARSLSATGDVGFGPPEYRRVWVRSATDPSAAAATWTSLPVDLSDQKGWLQFFLFGERSTSGTVQLLDAYSGEVLSGISADSSSPKQWEPATVRIPSRPFVVRATSKSGEARFGFSAPVVVPSLSFVAWRLTTLGAPLAALGLLGLVVSAAGLLVTGCPKGTASSVEIRTGADPTAF